MGGAVAKGEEKWKKPQVNEAGGGVEGGGALVSMRKNV